MIGAFRIEAYVIVSAAGMLADASGVQPASLHFEADQRHFQEGLDQADVVVNGRHSQEGHSNARNRRRLVLTRGIADVAPDPDNPKAQLWNPAGASFEAACAALGLRGFVLVLTIVGATVIFYWLGQLPRNFLASPKLERSRAGDKLLHLAKRIHSSR